MSLTVEHIRAATKPLPEIALNTGSSAAVGFLSSRAYALVYPFYTGAILSASITLIAELTSPVFEALLGQGKASDLTKLASRVAGLALGAALTIGVASYAGVAITATNAAYLAASVLATQATLAASRFLSNHTLFASVGVAKAV